MVKFFMSLFRFVNFVLVIGYLFFAISTKAKINSFDDKENIEVYFPQLSEIIRGMDDNSPMLKINNERVKEGSFNKMIADSAQGFTADLNINTYSIYENRPGGDYYQSYKTIGSIYVRKPFFQWGAIKAKNRIAELSENQNFKDSGNTKSNLIVHVKSEFLNMVLLSFELNLAKKILQLRDQNAENTRKRNELGLVTELNVNEAGIKKLEQSIQVSELERIFQSRNSNFVYDTGYNKKLDLNISADFKNFYLAHEIGLKIPLLVGLPSSNEIEQLKIQIETQDQQIIVANSGKKPKLSMVSAFFQDQIDLVDSPGSVRRNNFLIGIEANWNLWDSHLSKGKKSLAFAKKRKLEIELETKTRKLKLEVKDYQKQLVNISNQIKLSRKLVNSAKNRLEKSQIELNAKRITSINHFESEISLSNANLNLVRTIFHYMQIKLQYEKIINYSKS